MRIAVVMLLAVLLSSPVGSRELSNDDADYIVKVISNFEKYITWPDGNYEGNGDLLVITVIGQSPVNERLEKLDDSGTPGGRTFRVRVVNPSDMPANSHVLVVSDSDQAVMEKAVRLLVSRGTLIVGVTEGFGEMGAMVNFSPSASSDSGKIGIEINAGSIRDASFKVNPAFLKLAKVID